MGCAKISMALVMQKLFVGRVFEYTSYILALFTAAWTVSGVLVVAFQCHLPTPWDLARRSECIDTVAFGNYLASTNIVTEIMLVLVPLVVWTQKSPVGNRLYVSAVFWSRLSIVAAVIAQLYCSNASAPSSSLPSIYATTISTQLAQTLSVISACLPSLHPLVAKDLHSPNPSHNARNSDGSHWDARRFGSVSTHISKPSVDSTTTHPLHMTFSPPVESPYCHPLATHGLTRSSPSCDSYNFPRIPSNIALAVEDLEPPQNVFNRLIRSSSSLELDPLGSRNVEDLGCLPASDWDDNDDDNDNETGDVESGRATPERRPTSEYVFERSKVISVPEERTMFEIGREWNGFVPPLPTPKVVGEPPRAF
ncbi:hypothetical protein E8E13_004239 [Curvularia kusanoi]|uniref:Rhodopsin domain-containing protein n=1 Tax=Curvularia kusanoi TaxID=90978 RepID=A0A9P4T645_CURKU|nr:hypothetical protein E8E13_004239 [Curvularia kusanoi]